MKLFFRDLIFGLLLICSFRRTSALSDDHVQSFSLMSPDENIKVKVTFALGKPSYTVSYQADEVIKRSSLGLITSDGDFSEGFRSFGCHNKQKRQEQYELLQGKQRFVNVEYNQARCQLTNDHNLKLAIELVASNKAIAFRYFFPEDGSISPRTIYNETTTFALSTSPNDYQILQPYDSPTPKYQTFYQPRTLRDRIPIGTSNSSTGYGLPGAFKTSLRNRDIYVMLKEAGFDGNFPASHLSNHSDDAVFSLSFPDPLDANGNLGPAEPVSPLPLFSPWRIINLGISPAALVEDTSVTDLSAPSQITDSSWIKPGIASWSWWGNSSAPLNYTTTQQYIDLASNHSWDYSLLDSAWDNQTNALGSSVSFDTVNGYAHSKNVKLWLWLNSAGLNNDATANTPRNLLWQPNIRRETMARLSAAGVAGLKVDGIQSDKQQMMAYLLDILADAAHYKLMVVFHNCPVPHGWERTWPNLLSSEGLIASEYYTNPKIAYGDQMPENNVYQAFARYTIGPSEYSPGTFSAHQHSKDYSYTTYAHETALNVVIDSGLHVFPDTVEAYTQRIPSSIITILNEIPFVWDSTEYLGGDPGKYFVVAKRCGKKLYIAAINGETTFISASTNLSSPTYIAPEGVTRNLTLDLSHVGRAGDMTIVSDIAGTRLPNVSTAYFDGKHLNFAMQPFGGMLAVMTAM